MVKGNIKYTLLNMHSFGMRCFFVFVFVLLWSYYEIPKELCYAFTHTLRGCLAGNYMVARVPVK